VTRFQPQWLQSGSYAASVDRRLLQALWPASASAGASVTPTGTGMGVQAAPGQVAIPAANGTGSVLCTWDAPEIVTLDPAPPSGTNRTDLVICQARGNDLDGGVNNDFVITFAKGADGGAVPAVPPNAAALAQVAVAGGAASIVAGNITDRRPSGLAIPTVDTTVGKMIAYGTGPATAVDITAYAQVWGGVTAQCKANRRYIWLAWASFSQLNANSNPTGNWTSLRNDALAIRRDFIQGGFTNGGNYGGVGFAMYQPGADGPVNIPIMAVCGPGVARFLANGCNQAVIDVGLP
jgi:hypothetical protein